MVCVLCRVYFKQTDLLTSAPFVSKGLDRAGLKTFDMLSFIRFIVLGPIFWELKRMKLIAYFSVCYPRIPIGKVWIYRSLFVCLFVCLCLLVCVCVFVRLRISPSRIKLAASNFSRPFIGVRGRESHIFVNFAPPKAQNRTNRPARGPRPLAFKHYRRDAST